MTMQKIATPILKAIFGPEVTTRDFDFSNDFNFCPSPRFTGWLILGATLFLSVLVWGILSYRIHEYYPDNHVAFPINILIVPCACLSLAAYFNYRKTKRIKTFALILFFNIALILTFFVIYRYNILLSYQSWISKGMPEFGQLSD